MSRLLCGSGATGSLSRQDVNADWDKENQGCMARRPPRAGGSSAGVIMGKAALAASRPGKKGSDGEKTAAGSKTPLANNNGEKVVKTSVVPEVNMNISWMDSYTVVLKRGRHGYGFSVTGSSPVRISSVKQGSPAEYAGLQRGDCVVKINGQNVSRSMADSVAKIIRYSERQIVMDIHRSDCSDTWTNLSSISESMETLTESQSSLHQRPLEVPERSSPVLPPGVTSLERHSQLLPPPGNPLRKSDLSASTLSLQCALPKVDKTLQSLGCQDDERSRSIQKLLGLECQFVQQLEAGIHSYLIPLQDCMVSPSEHATLFQNITQIHSFSEHHLARLQEAEVSPEDPMPGALYRPWIEAMADAFEAYCNNVKNAFRLLLELSDNMDFRDLLRGLSQSAGGLSLTQFLQKPLQHVKDMFLTFQEIAVNTPLGHFDYENLKFIMETLRSACNRINNSNTRRTSSTSSLASLHSRSSSGCARSPQPPKTLNNSSSSEGSHPSGSSQVSTTSDQSRSSAQTKSSSDQSMSSIASVDSEVMDIQTRLILPDHMPALQLATATRHMIYSGDLFYFDGLLWNKLYVILLSDLLLITEPDEEGFLTIWEEPIVLHNINEVVCQGVHACEFSLLFAPGCRDVENSGPSSLMLQAPTTDLKATWTNLLQQRVLAYKAQLASSAHADNVV